MNQLFIYIPTFNRPSALQAQLRSLAPQVGKHPAQVRLLVNDNCSNAYAIEDIAKEYRQFENISFQKNGGNIGGNANIALGFVFSKPGEFLWILSDNDIISDGAVDYLLSVLAQDVDFYCFVDTLAQAQPVARTWEQGWQEPMDWRMGLISDALYNIRTVQDSMEDAFYYHNSSFPHLAVACSAAKKKGAVQFMLLPRSRISGAMHRSDECPTDYSLAQVCMPFLAALFPRKKARQFTLGWLGKHWWDMHYNRLRRYELYLQSKATIRHYGGGIAKIVLPLSFLLYLLLFPFSLLKKKLLEMAKKKLSPQMLEKLKRMRF